MIINSKRAKRNEILKGRGNVHIAFIANTEGMKKVYQKKSQLNIGQKLLILGCAEWEQL
ncbi:MAG: hypothetical protein ACLR4X_06625 [Clostridia bacterium]